MKTLESELMFQRRVIKARTDNPDLPVAALCERFGIYPQRLRTLLSGSIPYPARYKIVARRIKRPVEEVAENKDAKRSWCKECVGWFQNTEFYDSGNLTLIHYAHLCVRSRRASHEQKKNKQRR